MDGRLTFRRDLQVSRYDDLQDRQTRVIRDPVSAKFFYLSEYEYQLLQTFDGALTFDEVLAQLTAQGHYYSPEDARSILTKAAQAGLVLGSKFGTAEHQHEIKRRIESARKAQRFSSVYFLFIPLINPDRFLDKTLPYVRHLVNRWTGILLLLAFPPALYLLLSDLARVRTEYLFFFNLENLLYLWITLALTKLIHEFAHAYTAKSFGLRVPDMGLAFLIFFPCMYCNTTDAWQLADRRQRMAISLAGILAEAALAVVAIYFWYFSKPGVVNSVAFYLMAISFISTVLFNGNPLMRFDGYFILMDFFRLPNLYTRSFAQIRYLFMNRILGISAIPRAATTPRETAVFTAYGVSAFLYRVFLYTSIVMGVYYRFDKLVGFCLGVLAFALFIVRPLVKGARTLLMQRSHIHVQPAGALCLGGIVLIGLVAAFTPISRNTGYHCYVTSAKSQKLSVPLHTAVDRVFVEEGSPVRSGQVLFTLDTVELRNIILQKRIEGELLKREQLLLALDTDRMAWSSGKAIQLRKLKDEMSRITRDLHIAQNGLTAPFDGVITRWDYRVQKGFQPGEGVVIGEVESPTECLVHFLIPENELHKVKANAAGLLWFRRGSGVESRGTVAEIRPYSEQDLHDCPFSSRYGGDVATEPGEDHRIEAPLEAHYVGVIPFPNKEGIPLGTTGSFFVSSPPRSIALRAFDRIAKAFNRERLL